MTAELARVWRRFSASWLPPVGLAASLALLFAARLAAASSPDPEYRRALVLSQVNDAAGVGLWAAVLVGAWLALRPDLEDGFDALERIGAAGFATARLALAAGWLLLVAVVLAAAVAMVTFDLGRFDAETLHLAALAANRLPFLVILLAAGTLVPPYLALVPALLLQGFGGDAAYDRVALADGLVDDGVLVRAELSLRWALPPPLVDPLPGELLQGRSQALGDFPVRQGPGIWGTDLIAASTAADLGQWAVYVAALGVVFWLACRRRAAQVRRRTHLMPLRHG
ncbi:MAG TPA: hypothetical protein VG245_03530 [Candidatus Dormibacteraeota bacterium]|nr:hypothetical protein [Candidatus Dormibacteraeota bacterium]